MLGIRAIVVSALTGPSSLFAFVFQEHAEIVSRAWFAKIWNSVAAARRRPGRVACPCRGRCGAARHRAPPRRRRADHLSGGEGRRVSLARALCLQAPLVLLDEPLEDSTNARKCGCWTTLQLLAAFDATTLLVTHDRRGVRRAGPGGHGGRTRARVLATKRLNVMTNPRIKAGGRGARLLGPSVVNGRRVAVHRCAAARCWPSGVFDDRRASSIWSSRGIVGRINDVRVHVEWSPAGETPSPGDRVTVHATRSSRSRLMMPSSIDRDPRRTGLRSGGIAEVAA